MNSAVSQIVLMLVMMQVSRRIDLENESTLKIVRCCYLASTAIILGLYMYTRSIIDKKKDLTTFSYKEQSSPFAKEENNNEILTTVHQYDIEQINSAIKGVFQGVAMMAFMHLYMKYTNPLVMQSVMPLKSAFEQKLVQIHVFKKEPTGDLKRPFTNGPGLLSALTGGANNNAAAPLRDDSKEKVE